MYKNFTYSLRLPHMDRRTWPCMLKKMGLNSMCLVLPPSLMVSQSQNGVASGILSKPPPRSPQGYASADEVCRQAFRWTINLCGCQFSPAGHCPSIFWSFGPTCQVASHMLSLGSTCQDSPPASLHFALFQNAGAVGYAKLNLSGC